MGAADAPRLSPLWDGDGEPGYRPEVPKVWAPGGDVMAFTHIDRCDKCGNLLSHGEWLSGLCKVCEREAKRLLSLASIKAQ